MFIFILWSKRLSQWTETFFFFLCSDSDAVQTNEKEKTKKERGKKK